MQKQLAYSKMKTIKFSHNGEAQKATVRELEYSLVVTCFHGENQYTITTTSGQSGHMAALFSEACVDDVKIRHTSTWWRDEIHKLKETKIASAFCNKFIKEPDLGKKLYPLVLAFLNGLEPKGKQIHCRRSIVQRWQ